MTLDVKTALFVGGAVALPTLLQRTPLGRKAGKANRAAAATLGNVSGVHYAVPASASMVDAHASMRAAIDRLALDDKPNPSTVRSHWLAAYAAGVAADPLNYTMLAVNTGNGIIDTVGSSGDLAYCGADSTEGLTPLGAAVCTLRNADIGYAVAGARELGPVLALTSALAVAMDNADYLVDGTRRSDGIHAHSLTELPGLLVEKTLGALAGVAKDTLTTGLGLALLAGGGLYLAWRASK